MLSEDTGLCPQTVSNLLSAANDSVAMYFPEPLRGANSLPVSHGRDDILSCVYQWASDSWALGEPGRAGKQTVSQQARHLRVSTSESWDDHLFNWVIFCLKTKHHTYLLVLMEFPVRCWSNVVLFSCSTHLDFSMCLVSSRH